MNEFLAATVAILIFGTQKVRTLLSSDGLVLCNLILDILVGHALRSMFLEAAPAGRYFRARKGDERESEERV